MKKGNLVWPYRRNIPGWEYGMKEKTWTMCLFFNNYSFSLLECLQLPQSQGFDSAISSADRASYENDIPHSPKENVEDGSRSKLIVQLSEQVTLLDVKNQQLEQELEKAKTLISKFKLKRRTREVSTKTPQKHPQQRHARQELCVNIASLDIGSSSSEVELFG